MENFKIEVDADGVALVTFDVPGRTMNTLTAKVVQEFPQLIEQIRTNPAIKGAVLTSGKPTGFCAGADLGEMGSGALTSGADTRSEDDKLKAQFEGAFLLNETFRAMETCGKPSACALNGLATAGIGSDPCCPAP